MFVKNFDDAIGGIHFLADLAEKVCSNEEALALIKELFEGTGACPLWMGEDLPPRLAMNLLLASGCLRHVQASILADGEVEKSELEDSLEIVLPLASYFGNHLKNYQQFAEMSPKKLVDFLRFHQQDDAPWGGNIRTIMLDVKNLDHKAIDIADIEREFPGGCLVACLTAFCSKRRLFEIYNDIINYVMLKILSDDRRLRTSGIEKGIEGFQYLWSNILRHRLLDYYFTLVEDHYDDPRLIKVRRELAQVFENNR